MDLGRREVALAGEPLHLTPLEYKLLATLVRHAGKVLTHRQLLKEVWGPSAVSETQYLRVYMAQLRHKIEKDPARPALLTTETGVGYRLRVPRGRGPMRAKWLPYAAAAAVVAACTLVCSAMFRFFDDSNLIMVYLLGRGGGLLALRPRPVGARGLPRRRAASTSSSFRPTSPSPSPTPSTSSPSWSCWWSALLISTLAVRARQQAAAAQQALLAVEQERLRSTLLSSVSHDFRTPLAAITGAVTCLQEERALDADTRGDLEQTIREEAERLDRLVTNLLDMTRLESGAVELRRDWDSVEEVIGSALARVEGRLGARRLDTAIAADLPLVRIDAGLVEQVLVNLLENALKHTPEGTGIRVAARRDGSDVAVAVEDEGPGLPPGQEEKVFEKFYRGAGPEGSFGLGLADLPRDRDRPRRADLGPAGQWREAPGSTSPCPRPRKRPRPSAK